MPSTALNYPYCPSPALIFSHLPTLTQTSHICPVRVNQLFMADTFQYLIISVHICISQSQLLSVIPWSVYALSYRGTLFKYRQLANSRVSQGSVHCPQGQNIQRLNEHFLPIICNLAMMSTIAKTKNQKGKERHPHHHSPMLIHSLRLQLWFIVHVGSTHSVQGTTLHVVVSGSILAQSNNDASFL